MSTETEICQIRERGFTRFTLLNETPPKGYVVQGLTKIQTTSRPDHIWPDAWTRNGKAAQRREKQEWAIEKPNSYTREEFILLIPSDEEHKDIVKGARRKLGTSEAAAMPCTRAFFPQAYIRETVVSKTEKTKASEAKTRFSWTHQKLIADD